MISASLSLEQQVIQALLLVQKSYRLYPEGHPARAQAENRLRALCSTLSSHGLGLVLKLGEEDLRRRAGGSIPGKALQELSELAWTNGVDHFRLDQAALVEDTLALLRSWILAQQGGARGRGPGAFTPAPVGATGSFPVYHPPAELEAAPVPKSVPLSSENVDSLVIIPSIPERSIPVAPAEIDVHAAPRLPVDTPAAVPAPSGARKDDEAFGWLSDCWAALSLERRRDEERLNHLLHFLGGELGDGTLRPVRLLGPVPGIDTLITHALDVARLSILTCRAAGLSGDLLACAAEAALFADIGMRSVPPEIIQRSSRFSKEEFRMIRRHPVVGARWLMATPGVPDLAGVVALEHHIRIDGRGYPQVPTPWERHPVSMIVQVCDSYAALRTPRPFREAFGEAEARTLMRRLTGTALDGDAVELLLGRAVPAGCILL